MDKNYSGKNCDHGNRLHGKEAHDRTKEFLGKGVSYCAI